MTSLPPSRAVLALASQYVWAVCLVMHAVLLALTNGGRAWVVWSASAAMAATGLWLLTRATRAYARSLIEEAARTLRHRYHAR